MLTKYQHKMRVKSQCNSHQNHINFFFEKYEMYNNLTSKNTAPHQVRHNKTQMLTYLNHDQWCHSADPRDLAPFGDTPQLVPTKSSFLHYCGDVEESQNYSRH